MILATHIHGSGGILFIIVLIFVLYRLMLACGVDTRRYREVRDFMMPLLFVIGILVLAAKIVFGV